MKVGRYLVHDPRRLIGRDRRAKKACLRGIPCQRGVREWAGVVKREAVKNGFCPRATRGGCKFVHNAVRGNPVRKGCAVKVSSTIEGHGDRVNAISGSPEGVEYAFRPSTVIGSQFEDDAVVLLISPAAGSVEIARLVQNQRRWRSKVRRHRLQTDSQ